MTNDNLYIENGGLIDNQPFSLKINGIQLPYDVEFSIKGDKMIAISQIIDGGQLFERVTEKAHQIDFTFVLREYENAKRSIAPLDNSIIRFYNKYVTPTYQKQIYPISELKKIWQSIWKKNEIVKVENSILNSIGIVEIVCQDISLSTKRGFLGIEMKLSGLENMYIDENLTTTIT